MPSLDDDQLCEKWDVEMALEHLHGKFEDPNKVFHLTPVNGYKATEEDMEALEFLALEWDWTYDTRPQVNPAPPEGLQASAVLSKDEFLSQFENDSLLDK